jgi:hypothetical protein
VRDLNHSGASFNSCSFLRHPLSRFVFYYFSFNSQCLGRFLSSLFLSRIFSIGVSCSLFFSHGRDSHKQVSKNKPHWRKFILHLIRHRSRGKVSKNSSTTAFLLAFFHLVPFEVICGVVVTKLRRLHSASTWPPFRLCAHSVASKSTLPPRQTFGQRTGTVSQKTGSPQNTPRDRTPPPLHSAQFAAPFRRQNFVTPGH